MRSIKDFVKNMRKDHVFVDYEDTCPTCLKIATLHYRSSVINQIDYFFDKLTQEGAWKNLNLNFYNSILFNTCPYHKIDYTGNYNIYDENFDYDYKSRDDYNYDDIGRDKWIKNVINRYCKYNGKNSQYQQFDALIMDVNSLLIVLMRDGQTYKLYRLCTAVLDKFYYHFPMCPSKSAKYVNCSIFCTIIEIGLYNIHINFFPK